MATTKMTVFWQDIAGQGQFRTLTTAAGASSLLSQLLIKSNVLAVQTWEGVEGGGSGAGAAVQYPTVQSVAYLRFNDGAGHVATVALPAPLGSIFLADGISVDPSQITAIIAAAIGSVQTAAGTLVTAFDSGWLGTGPATR